MMNIAFFDQNFLVQREAIAALQRNLSNEKLIILKTASEPHCSELKPIIDAIKKYSVKLVFTINDWGLDSEGELTQWFEKNNIIHVNWYVDDPFFKEAMSGVVWAPRANRFDFVSDRGYVAALRERGYKAYFMPLASDPSLFFPILPKPTIQYPISFVGNSYKKDLNDFSVGYENYLESTVSLIYDLYRKYSRDTTYDIEKEITVFIEKNPPPPHLSCKKAFFLIKYTVGYFYRRHLVLDVAAAFKDFKIIGDAFWYLDLPQERVIVGKGYYSDLNTIYNQTKVNIDINRVVIRDGFTQRIFDCLASGSFIITSFKPVVFDFFVTEGEKCELVVFHNGDHLKRLIEHYLKNDVEREAIITQGRKKVLAEHTYDRRIQSIFQILDNEGIRF